MWAPTSFLVCVVSPTILMLIVGDIVGQRGCIAQSSDGFDQHQVLTLASCIPSKDWHTPRSCMQSLLGRHTDKAVSAKPWAVNRGGPLTLLAWIFGSTAIDDFTAVMMTDCFALLARINKRSPLRCDVAYLDNKCCWVFEKASPGL